MRVRARACVGAHPAASAAGCGAFALLGYGAPVAVLLLLRPVLVHLRWLVTELDARWLRLWWLPLSTNLRFVRREADISNKNKYQKKVTWLIL